MISVSALTVLVYIALGVSTFSIGMLLFMVAHDIKRGKLW